MLQDVGNAMRHVLAVSPSGIMALPPLSASPSPVSNKLLQSRSYLDANGFNATAILSNRQEHQVQAIAATFASCSILASVCALYWFCMMRRNFRRDLVLLLVCGDLWKSVWFLVSASTSLSIGAVLSDSSFCQASGYFLQVGFEACDLAILLMSLHMQLQIFPPKNSFLGNDGLYRARYAALAVWFILPNVLVSLAFVNNNSAFMSQGGFCSLPIRPFWYRLALSWIPRYLVWMYILYVAIRIYRHVGFEFKVFGEERDRSSSFGMAGSVTSNTGPSTAAMFTQQSGSATLDAAAVEKHAGADSHIAPDEDDYDRVGPSTPTTISRPAIARLKLFDAGRRRSIPSWTPPFGASSMQHMELFEEPKSSRSKSNPSSRRGSRQISVDTADFAPPPTLVPWHQDRGSVSTSGSLKTTGAQSHDRTSPGLETISEQKPRTTDPAVNVANRAMQKRRKAIQRQLRLLFIYPCVYLLMWVIPFVSHAMRYNNHFAQHPIFPITAISTFCQVSLGFVDVIIFCWREKPWRHIPGSNGTFLGSFLFWRFAFKRQWVEERRKSSAPLGALRAQEQTNSSQNGFLQSLKRWSMSVSSKAGSRLPSQGSMFPGATPDTPPTPRRVMRPMMHRRAQSGGSDRRVLAAERAHARLAMERAEYQQHRRSLDLRTTSVPNTHPLAAQEQQAHPARKEWWDRQMSITDDYHDTRPGSKDQP